MKLIDSGICVQGFKAGGIKKRNDGLTIILSEREANCAMMITSNKIKAAPLIVSQKNQKDGMTFGIVASSGNANTYTGEDGIKDAEDMCRLAAERFHLDEEDFIVASTGVIGRRLDMDIMKKLINRASGDIETSRDASLKAARAIMTTDTKEKMISVETQLQTGGLVEIGGIAKGSGMIAPDLKHATMLCFLTTNARVPKGKIKESLKTAVEQSFNSVVVDGDTSTNDMVVLLANGMAGNRDIDKNFQEALNFITRELAKMIAKDGEGATKFFEVIIKNASTSEDARKVARAITSSNLVKTALFGRDPNWGRVIAAIGSSGAEIQPEKISLYFANENDKVSLVDKGKVLAFQDTRELKKAKEILEANEITITVDLHSGNKNARAYGCDLTCDYVKMNASYTT